jgi:hypothetical protein
VANVLQEIDSNNIRLCALEQRNRASHQPLSPNEVAVARLQQHLIERVHLPRIKTAQRGGGVLRLRYSRRPTLCDGVTGLRPPDAWYSKEVRTRSADTLNGVSRGTADYHTRPEDPGKAQSLVCDSLFSTALVLHCAAYWSTTAMASVTTAAASVPYTNLTSAPNSTSLLASLWFCVKVIYSYQSPAAPCSVDCQTENFTTATSTISLLEYISDLPTKTITGFSTFTTYCSGGAVEPSYLAALFPVDTHTHRVKICRSESH